MKTQDKWNGSKPAQDHRLNRIYTEKKRRQKM